MKRSFLVFILFCFSTILAQNSELPTNQNVEPRSLMMNTHDPNLKSFPEKSFYKQKANWQYIIDTTWGLGLPTEQKLQLFDDIWSKVDQTWGGFPNLTVNWDSLKNYYRPIVEAGVSRGRFYSILFKLKLALNEIHFWVRDFGIDSTMGYYTVNSNEYPNYLSFNYQPGIPLLNLFSTFFRTNFGAGVTALADGSALVYSVMPNHPLNLQAGDLILGYDGILWKQTLNELFEAELPVLVGGSSFASSSSSLMHSAVNCVGMNWGLFDTIDIVKYSTNDTLHFPTSLLSSIKQPYFVATEQLPVSGVTFPDINNNKMVSWGIVEGTNIGYIYVLDWKGTPEGQTRVLFGQAVDELMHVNNMDGLILDFRTNYGGWPEYANDGFKHLFNIDPTSNYSRAIRVSGNDHFLFTIISPPSADFFTPTPELFDHPIAVLTGPRAMSAGDYNAFRMRFHPLSRFFGKRTDCAYTDYNNDPIFNFDYYRYRVDNGSVYSNYNNEGYLIHKGFPVDEEIWLTRYGVAIGQDDVVQKALLWINNKAYPHDTYSDRLYYSPVNDSVHLFTTIENPNAHQLSARAYINNLDATLIDSVNFHQINSSKEWKADLSLSQAEEFYKVSVKLVDETDSNHVTIPYVARFTTAGPVTLDSISIRKQFTNYAVRPFVHNAGTTTTIPNASMKLICNDPWVKSIGTSIAPLPDLPPSTSTGISTWCSVSYTDSILPGYFNFKVEIRSDNFTYWTDSIRVNVITDVDDNVQQPLTFKLEQNFPNPFNPSTKISFTIPNSDSPLLGGARGGSITLKVYDVLGNEIASLVNEEKEAGNYEIEFNAEKLTSGVYFYQLKAGEVVSTKKMILLR